METKAFTEVKQADTCSLTAVIATLGVVDSDGDILEPGSFGSQTVPFLWAHDQSMVPLGKARVREVGDQVVADVEILDQATCDWLKLDFATDPRQQYSWGFLVPEGAAERRDDGVRVISRVDLLEVSGVLRGASVGTRTVGVKSACGCGGTCEATRRPELSPGEAFLEERELARRGQIRVKFGTPPAWLQRITEQVAREFDCEGRPSVVMFRKAKLTDRRAAPFDADCIGMTSSSDQPFSAVYVKSGMSDFDTLATALHEVCHLLGQKDERVCDAWAHEQAARFIDPDADEYKDVKGLRLADGSFVPMVFPS